jgi:2-oxoglutarate ferredoxin oxidoreductase subunit alpha
MEEQCLTLVDDPRKGKNMFALGMLSWIYDRDLERVYEQIAHTFRKKSEAVYQRNVELVNLGYAWAAEHLDFRIAIPRRA